MRLTGLTPGCRPSDPGWDIRGTRTTDEKHDSARHLRRDAVRGRHGVRPASRESPADAGFAKWDRNKDGFDAEELAKAFRGPNAKVIEHKAGGQPDAHPDHQFLNCWDVTRTGR